MPTMTVTKSEKGTIMWQVRKWDSFYNDWTMIPENFDSREDAVKRACELARELDDDFEEIQVHIECLGGTAFQMVGYIDFEQDDDGKFEPYLEECFC